MLTQSDPGMLARVNAKAWEKANSLRSEAERTGAESILMEVIALQAAALWSKDTKWYARDFIVASGITEGWMVDRVLEWACHRVT